jgi:hypothetical protein
MKRFRSGASIAWAFGVSALLCVACGGKETAEVTPQAKAPPATTVTSEMQARLVLADQVDGTKDGVVARCAGCMLGMDGSADHALAVGDFQMHFCSDVCRGQFAEDVQKSVMAMSVPEG